MFCFIVVMPSVGAAYHHATLISHQLEVTVTIHHHVTANRSHSTTTNHLLEASVVVRRRAEDDGLDEERLVAVIFLVSTDDAEAPAARVAPPQDNLMTAVQVAARGGQRAE